MNTLGLLYTGTVKAGPLMIDSVPILRDRVRKHANCRQWRDCFATEKIVDIMFKVWNDEFGRCFCDKHRRERCNECCMFFTEPNKMLEEQIGLRKARSKAEELAEEKVILERGIAYMMQGDPRTGASMQENLDYELKRVQTELKTIEENGKADEINAALQKAYLKARTQDAESAALKRAVKQISRGRTDFQMGGPDR